ncbi:MAG: hypothetical protein COS94_05745 [Candidatus Hydrogenedentes bacterium CG07_land_8_20_14_0_80_42_17]|nr:MAG: hypothetical protein AUJ18_10865 [Candidatus Hydrogenedentes bacterium CG1_02_42_14]PIU47750.1 MAG: hypothetical protein COS94_05745 [Candidatus Hydrogenedentes bacterium CG07_land_8_20_14_0_80_42_17]
MQSEKLVRRFKDEAVSVYSIEGGNFSQRLKRYIVSTRDTRNLMNYPEIINCDFTKLMSNGIINALKGLNILERLSCIDSKTVNVYHILRGSLNFQIGRALNNAFGYKWHSSSYVSSQRVLQNGKYETSDNSYRKFQIPQNATIYTADIVASGISLNDAIEYVMHFLESNKITIKNFIFITIGCIEAEKILSKWDSIFRNKFPEYDRTILIYLEGRFALANKNTPLHNSSPDTDLLKNYKFGALLAPEFEHSQFEKMPTALEGCVIYDGGKKGFEPINHIRDILNFWEKQMKIAVEKNLSLWEEYNSRFSLEMYFENISELKKGSPELLMANKNNYWDGITIEESNTLYSRFKWLWSDERIKFALEPGSFKPVCRKKINYLKSLIS